MSYALDIMANSLTQQQFFQPKFLLTKINNSDSLNEQY